MSVKHLKTQNVRKSHQSVFMMSQTNKSQKCDILRQSKNLSHARKMFHVPQPLNKRDFYSFSLQFPIFKTHTFVLQANTKFALKVCNIENCILSLYFIYNTALSFCLFFARSMFDLEQNVRFNEFALMYSLR